MTGEGAHRQIAAAAQVYVAPPARVVRSRVLGEWVFFAVDNEKDVIQAEHAAGRFYEPEELEILRRHFPLGGRFCDIGANVGNHSVFAAKFLRARRVVLVEPNPLAIPLLTANIMLNGLEDVCDLSRLGVGLSDGAVAQASIRTGRNNLGGARVKEGEGEIPIRSGDALLEGEDFDLIKIDVEGMEMKVLAGLDGVLARNPVPIFIEVDQKNYAAFDQWAARWGYEKLEEFQRYPTNRNYLIRPRG